MLAFFVRTAAMTAIVLAAAAAPAAAQDAPAQPPPPPPPAAQADEPRLVFEREVFTYRGRTRRDPFTPLTTGGEGPLFSDVQLHMIIFSDDPSESIASLSVRGGRRMRLRRGETIGNATVIDIGVTHVVFSVMDFGTRRQEVLYLKTPREGA
jgi:hypothetical protein